jgi:hypothetical protein
MGSRMSNETVYASWRPKAIMPHSVVAQTVFLNPREYEQRSNRNPDSVDFPITSKQDVAVLKGEMCFEITPPFVRRNNPNHTDVYVFTSANGLRASDCPTMRFVGQVMKGTDTEDDKDKSVSVQVAGPMTTVNMGTEWIYAGNTVVARWPEYNVRNGHKIPKIQVMGTPGSKFLFNMSALRMSDVYGEFVDIMARVWESWKALSPTQKRDMTHDNLFNQFRYMAERYSLVLNTDYEKDCPVLKFLHLVIEFLCEKQVSGGLRASWMPTTDSEAFIAHQDAMNGVLGKRKAVSSNRADSLAPALPARKTMRLAAPSEEEESEEEEQEPDSPQDEDEKRSDKVTDDVDEQDEDRESSRIDANPRKRGISNTLLLLPVTTSNDKPFQSALSFMGLLAEQYNFYHRLAIGKALTSAAPGQPLDILMGYFH